MRRWSSRSLLQSFRLVVEISTSNNAPDPSEDFTQEERIFTRALMPDGRCCTTVLKQCAFGPSIIAPNGSGRQFVGKLNAAASTPMPAQWFHPDQTPRQRGSLPPSRPSSDQTLPIIPPSHWKLTGNLYVCCRFRFRATVLRGTDKKQTNLRVPIFREEVDQSIQVDMVERDWWNGAVGGNILKHVASNQSVTSFRCFCTW